MPKILLSVSISPNTAPGDIVEVSQEELERLSGKGFGTPVKEPKEDTIRTAVEDTNVNKAIKKGKP